MHQHKQHGFTLIELAITLVIIGLLVGGVLVGRDLIDAATIRSQISQIEKYQTAVKIFQLKYDGYLPGDIPDPNASAFGLAARGTVRAEGDGNGVIEGIWAIGFYYGYQQSSGETVGFWTDLSDAKLIDGNFTDYGAIKNQYVDTTNISLYLPQAKLGNSNYVYAYSLNSQNYFGIVGVSRIASTITTGMDTVPSISVKAAYAIDIKIDDGLPQYGKVNVVYTHKFGTGYWWANGLTSAPWKNTNATPASDTSCIDNNNVASGKQQYSIAYNGGNGLSCALSFKFQ